MGYQIKLRLKALPELEAYLRREQRKDHYYLTHRHMLHLFADILDSERTVGRTRALHSSEALSKWQTYRANLLHCEDQLPIPVFSFIKPILGRRFILHVLLSMGKFSNKLDLMLSTNTWQQFVKAGLVTGEPSMEIVKKLTREFAEKQLRFYPVPVRTFDFYLVAAYQTLQSCLLHDAVPIAETPPSLFTSIVDGANESFTDHKSKMKRDALEAIYSQLIVLQLTSAREAHH